MPTKTPIRAHAFQPNKIISALIGSALLAGCGGETENILNDASDTSTNVSVRVELPTRVIALGENLVVQSTVSGASGNLVPGTNGTYQGSFILPFNVEQTVYLSIRRESDNLLLATGERQLLASGISLSVFFPEQQIKVDIDSDGDGFDNITEIEDGSDPLGRNGDYDGDGRADAVDDDDDNDGIKDYNDAFPYNANESIDSDNDGLGNNADPDDDNDGVGDRDDRFPLDPTESVDTDRDGIGNNADTDDDNDGISDANDPAPLDANQSFDTDGDGISDTVDTDDDNDGVNDVNDRFPLDDSESLDTDNDGIGNNADPDDDNDDTLDAADPQPLNANITGREDSDGDGHPDIDDEFPLDPNEFNDQDGDGIGNNADDDDDGNGIPDRQEDAIVVIPRVNTPPTMDGIFAWREWRNAARCDSKGNYLSISHLLQGNADNPRSWWSDNWRAVHDGTYLYLMVQVRNEPFYERYNDSGRFWQDDSVEVYIDSGNEKSTTYDSNDYQLGFNFATGSQAIFGSNSATTARTYQVTSIGTDTSANTSAIYEIRIHLGSVGIPIGSKFAMDVQLNDDDDGGDRDLKWAWYSPVGEDEAWFNPSVFGTAILAPGAVRD